MHWISRRNRYLANSRKSLEDVAQSTTSSDRSSAEFLTAILGRGVVFVSGAFITLITSFLGSAVAAYLTINYLESFKAQEALRTFSVTQLYQPLRQKSLKCHELRLAAVSHARTVFNMSELVLLQFIDARKHGKASMLSQASGLMPALKGFMEQYTAAFTALSKSGDEIALCEREVSFASHELATALGLNDKFSVLDREFFEDRPIRPKNSQYSIVIVYLNNPAAVRSLVRAFEDAENGHLERADSALSKIQSELQKSVDSASADLAFQSKLFSAGVERDNKVIGLFLTEFRRRFELTPDVSLARIVDDLLGSPPSAAKSSAVSNDVPAR